jgi:hypothetical protein
MGYRLVCYKIDERFLEAFQGKRHESFISFESPVVLFKLLSGNRWDLLKMMTGAGAMSIREASRIEDCLEPEELLLIFIKQRPLFKWALFVLN